MTFSETLNENFARFTNTIIHWVGIYFPEFRGISPFMWVNVEDLTEADDPMILTVEEDLRYLPLDGIRLIARERWRQVEEKGYTAEHDDGHVRDELADAAAFYAISDKHRYRLLGSWPFEPGGLMRKRQYSRIRQLAIAGAFIAAEIDRLKRLEAATETGENLETGR